MPPWRDGKTTVLVPVNGEIAKGEAPPIAADSSSEAGSDEDKDVDGAVDTEAEKDDKEGE